MSKDLKARNQCSQVESSWWITLAKGNKKKARGKMLEKLMARAFVASFWDTDYGE